MAKRSRKRRPALATAQAPAGEPPVADEPGPEPVVAPELLVTPPAPELPRGERRNAEARANLKPLGEGERPGAVTVGAIVAFVLAAANLILLAAGYHVQGKSSGPAGAILFAAIMLFAAWGMWTVRYWAVLGFEALLAVVVVIAALSLMVASKWQGAAISLVVIGLGGTLFWKLVRAMARIQMPTYER